MYKVSKFTYDELHKLTLGEDVHFISDCEFFPNFNVKGKVLQLGMNGTEIIFKFRTRQGKTISIGSHMKNLQFELLK